MSLLMHWITQARPASAMGCTRTCVLQFSRACGCNGSHKLVFPCQHIGLHKGLPWCTVVIPLIDAHRAIRQLREKPRHAGKITLKYD